jgi:putative ABC transport system permease protein
MRATGAFVGTSLGLFAVVATSVNQRVQESGIRLALGAPRGNVIRLVFVRGMRQVTIGLVLGLGASLWVTRFFGSLLVACSPRGQVRLAAYS